MFSDFSHPDKYHYTAIVDSMAQVYDGDTITRCRIDLGFNVHVVETLRLVGIDTPELRGPERESGIISRDFLRSHIELGKPFGIRTHKGKGKYGRWLAEIGVGGVNLNQLMVNEGYAKLYWPR